VIIGAAGAMLFAEPIKIPMQFCIQDQMGRDLLFEYMKSAHCGELLLFCEEIAT